MSFPILQFELGGWLSQEIGLCGVAKMAVKLRIRIFVMQYKNPELIEDKIILPTKNEIFGMKIKYYLCLL